MESLISDCFLGFSILFVRTKGCILLVLVPNQDIFEVKRSDHNSCNISLKNVKGLSLFISWT